MDQNDIVLFKMDGCQFCPQMERIFQNLHRDGAIDSLQVIDVMRQPEIAAKYNIRSVPAYRINQNLFNGLKTRTEIEQLLREPDESWWREVLVNELSDGQLELVEKKIRQHSTAVEAMLKLLAEKQTALVVRIGLTAVIETMSAQGELTDYESQFIKLSFSEVESIMIDAIYYLALLGTEAARNRLQTLAQQGTQNIASHAQEALQELSA
ncbi:MAG: thioredoxin family protein [Gammaproteobacteria bacterium]|nr:thioredoxin family protein [Gammaproteobacteria bacterium]